MTDSSILVVDRDAGFAADVARSLESAGCETACAAGPCAARQMLAASSFGLALVSAGPDPREEAELIRSLGRDETYVEVIVLAADPGAPEITSLYGCGNVYSIRSRAREGLVDLFWDVTRALERRALRRQNARLLIELRDARDDLRDQFEFLAQVEKVAAVGRIALDAAEQLRMPLAAMAAYGDYIARAVGASTEPWTEERRQTAVDYARGLEEAASQCLAVVRALRTLGGPDCGEAEPTDLHEILCDTLGLLRHLLDSRRIAVHARVSPEPPIVAAAPDRLRQIVAHLVLNAMQAMPEGGTLTVSTSALPGGGATLALQDTGRGIEPEVLAHVFEPFFTTRPLGQGTGLGLLVSRRWVRAWDGDLDLANAPGGGAVATLTLAAPAVALPQPGLQAAALAAVGQESGLQAA